MAEGRTSRRTRPLNEYQRAEILRRRLPELLELEALKLLARGVGEVRTEAEILYEDHIFPIYSYAFGSEDPRVPRVAFIGGVHGLERVGTNVAISYLKTILELVQWDKGMQHLLQSCRILFLPLVNPVGMFAKTRSNGNGIDLMRNAPLDAAVKPNLLLVGGHRLSSRIPWFRGTKDEPMEKEAEALCSFVRRELYKAPFSIALDMHSGFGMVDRLWFPFAYSREPLDCVDKIYALKTRLDRSLPNHYYLMEPQSMRYLSHGDLWDYLYLEQRREAPDRILLPFTLEMGSWLWVKKNPRQAFSALGIFNPMIPHRLQRTLRRHLGLLDFLVRAAVSHENWSHPSRILSEGYGQKARELWYADRSVS